MLGRATVTLATFVLLAAVLSRQGLLFILALLLLLATFVSRLWDSFILEGITFGRRLSQPRVFWGETVDLWLEVTNAKWLPIAWLEVAEEIPADLEPLAGATRPGTKLGRRYLVSLFTLRWYERVGRRYRLRCPQRGAFQIGPASLQSGDLFGFNTHAVDLPESLELLVYPKVVPLAALDLPTAHPLGEQRSARRLLEDPARTVGSRPYQPGDSLRRVHWKATAHTRTLQARVYEPSTTQRLGLFLNLNTAGSAWWWQAYDAARLELAIVVVASLAAWAMQNQVPYGLFANGRARLADDRIRLPVSQSPEQLTQVLEALARALPYATLALPDLLAQEARGLPWGCTIVVVTAVVGEDLLVALSDLRQRGHPVQLILVGDDQPPLRLAGVSVHRVGGEDRWRELETLTL